MTLLFTCSESVQPPRHQPAAFPPGTLREGQNVTNP